MESWKKIPGIPYEASNLGRIRRKGGKVLRPIKAGDGYQKLTVRGRQEYIHRLVAMAWIGDIPQGWEVNHLDFDRHNNRLENLEIVTPSMNARHAAAPVWHRSQIKIAIFQ